MLETLMSLDIEASTSLTAANDGRTAFVAHQGGIVRLDLQRKSAVSVKAPEGIELGGFERIRWHRNALVGVQLQPDQSRHVVRLALRGADTVTDATVIDAPLAPDAGPTFATISGDSLYYLVTQHTQASTPAAGQIMSVTVKRVRLP
jgi:hypothetical protein